MPLPGRELAESATAACTLCHSVNTVRVFPAALAVGGEARPQPAEPGEAACYDHPAKRAVAACAQCGRFVCALCEVKTGGETWCPSCVAAGAGRARGALADAPRTLWDTATLVLPLASLIMWPFTILAGPAAVLLSIWKWKQPLSLVRRTHWRMVLGMILGLAETGAWVMGIILYLGYRSRR